MKLFLKAVAAFLCVFGLVSISQAQTTTITASHIYMGGVPIPAGTVTFTPVAANGVPISFAMGGGGLNSPSAFSCKIANGAIVGTCSVPDASLTTPANIDYSIQVTNTPTQKAFTLTAVPSIQGPSWALDAYGPPAQTTNVQPIQVSYGTASAPSPCVSPSFYIRNSGGGQLYMCVAGAPVLVMGSGGSVTSSAMQSATAGLTGCNVVGNAWNPATNTCTSGAKSIAIENVFSGAGTINYAHNLGTPNPLYSCYTLSGASSFTVAEVDLNNVAVTTAGASDLVCAFTFAPAPIVPPGDFSFIVSPSSPTLVPPLGTSHLAFSITQTASGSYSSITTYSLSSSPSGITGTFVPATITTAGTSTLTTNIPYNQASGTNTLTLTGLGGGHTHSQTPTISIATTNNGLLEGWPSNEGSGSTLNTVSSSGDNATTTAVTWTTPTGFPVPVATYNGTTSIATGTNNTNTNFDGTLPFSVCAWPSFNVYNVGEAIVGNLNTSSNYIGWEMSLDNGGRLDLFIINNFGTGNAIQILQNTATLSGSAAQFVCATYDGSKHAVGGTLYVNGSSVTLATPPHDGLTGSSANTNPVFFGARQDGSTPLNGSVAYVRVYNRVLTSGEISTLFTAGPQ